MTTTKNTTSNTTTTNTKREKKLTAEELKLQALTTKREALELFFNGLKEKAARLEAVKLELQAEAKKPKPKKALTKAKREALKEAKTEAEKLALQYGKAKANTSTKAKLSRELASINALVDELESELFSLEAMAEKPKLLKEEKAELEKALEEGRALEEYKKAELEAVKLELLPLIQSKAKKQAEKSEKLFNGFKEYRLEALEKPKAQAEKKALTKKERAEALKLYNEANESEEKSIEEALARYTLTMYEASTSREALELNEAKREATATEYRSIIAKLRALALEEGKRAELEEAREELTKKKAELEALNEEREELEKKLLEGGRALASSTARKLFERTGDEQYSQMRREAREGAKLYEKGSLYTEEAEEEAEELEQEEAEELALELEYLNEHSFTDDITAEAFAIMYDIMAEKKLEHILERASFERSSRQRIQVISGLKAEESKREERAPEELSALRELRRRLFSYVHSEKKALSSSRFNYIENEEESEEGRAQVYRAKASALFASNHGESYSLEEAKSLLALVELLGLSDNEKKALELKACSYSLEAVARYMGISKGTAQEYVKRARKKALKVAEEPKLLRFEYIGRALAQELKEAKAELEEALEEGEEKRELTTSEKLALLDMRAEERALEELALERTREEQRLEREKKLLEAEPKLQEAREELELALEEYKKAELELGKVRAKRTKLGKGSAKAITSRELEALEEELEKKREAFEGKKEELEKASELARSLEAMAREKLEKSTK